jgi:hypothetical protein
MAVLLPRLAVIENTWLDLKPLPIWKGTSCVRFPAGIVTVGGIEIAGSLATRVMGELLEGRFKKIRNTP